jgi:16S rRNA (guanine527-N7)-methyltransferase
VPELRSAGRIADLGSGAGFPGLPLATLVPEVDLVESAARKCAVIERLAAAAGLSGVRALPVRVEELGHSDYPLVTARALAPLSVLVEYAAPLLRPGGQLVAWKGVRDAAEELRGEEAGRVVGVSPVRVVPVTPFPGAHSRHLHFYEKTAPTPARFPRRPGMARKRPITARG